MKVFWRNIYQCKDTGKTYIGAWAYKTVKDAEDMAKSMDDLYIYRIKVTLKPGVHV